MQAVYPPGIQLVVIQDGGYIGHALGVPAPESHQYGSYLRWLIRLYWHGLFHRLRRSRRLVEEPLGRTAPAAAPDESERQRLEAEASRRPDSRRASKKTLGMVNVRSLKYDPDEVFQRCPIRLAHPYATLLHGRVCIAMERYMAADGILHRFDPHTAFPEAIHHHAISARTFWRYGWLNGGKASSLARCGSAARGRTGHCQLRLEHPCGKGSTGRCISKAKQLRSAMRHGKRLIWQAVHRQPERRVDLGAR